MIEGALARRQAGIALAGDTLLTPRSRFVRGHRRSADRTGEENSTGAGGVKLFLTKTVGDWRVDHRREKIAAKPGTSGWRRKSCRMNAAGAAFANIDGVKAMTDVLPVLPAKAPERDVPGAGVQALLCYQTSLNCRAWKSICFPWAP